MKHAQDSAHLHALAGDGVLQLVEVKLLVGFKFGFLEDGGGVKVGTQPVVALCDVALVELELGG